jgi:hypothetical protein
MLRYVSTPGAGRAASEIVGSCPSDACAAVPVNAAVAISRGAASREIVRDNPLAKPLATFTPKHTSKPCQQSKKLPKTQN